MSVCMATFMNKTAKAHLVECVIIFALWLWACVGYCRSVWEMMIVCAA